MQLYLIRHAQSENNALWYSTGSSFGRNEDPSLTDIGKRQADELAGFLSKGCAIQNLDKGDLQNTKGFFLSHLYTSLMIRAVETGRVIAQSLNMALIAWPDLHEEGGIYLKDEISGERIGQPGKGEMFFKEYFPEMEIQGHLDEMGWWKNRPYETEEMSRERARLVYQELLNRHGGTNDRVAWITHGGFYNQFMAELLGIRPTHDIWFTINNAAITRVDFETEGIAVVYQNRVDFLSKSLIS